MEGGGWRVEGVGWEIEDEEWGMGDGGWQESEDGGWERLPCSQTSHHCRKVISGASGQNYT